MQAPSYSGLWHEAKDPSSHPKKARLGKKARPEMAQPGNIRRREEENEKKRGKQGRAKRLNPSHADLVPITITYEAVEPTPSLPFLFSPGPPCVPCSVRNLRTLSITKIGTFTRDLRLFPQRDRILLLCMRMFLGQDLCMRHE